MKHLAVEGQLDGQPVTGVKWPFVQCWLISSLNQGAVLGFKT